MRLTKRQVTIIAIAAFLVGAFAAELPDLPDFQAAAHSSLLIKR
jgi:hypothetical protein